LHLNDSEYSNQTKWQAKAGHDSLVVWDDICPLLFLNNFLSTNFCQTVLVQVLAIQADKNNFKPSYTISYVKMLRIVQNITKDFFSVKCAIVSVNVLKFQ
jgi:hypothetical protein